MNVDVDKLTLRVVACWLLVSSMEMVSSPSLTVYADSPAVLSQTDQKGLDLKSWSTKIGEVAYQRGPEIAFFRNSIKFNGSQGISIVGTMIASPKCITVDLQHLQNAQGNLSITDRGTNKRSYQPKKGQPATSDTSLIRSLYLPFSASMVESLKDFPDNTPLTWIDYSNNFGNPNYVSYARGSIFYPTGFNFGKKFEQNFKEPLYSFIQYPDGTLEFDYVRYLITKTEKVDGYYDVVSGNAFIRERQLPPDTVIFSATPLVINGEAADLATSIHQGMFQDLRQLFVLPPVKNPENVRPGEFGLQQVPKEIRAGIFFGLDELAANDYEKAADALKNPVYLQTTLNISDTQKITLTKEQTKGLLATSGYVEVTNEELAHMSNLETAVSKSKLKEGQYFFESAAKIAIFLKPSPYPQLLLGRTNEGLIFVQSIGGSSGEIGITIKEISSYANKLGLKDLFSVTQGTGSLLGYLSTNSGNDKPETLEKNYHVLVGASEGRQAGSAVIDFLSRPSCTDEKK